MTSTIVRRHDAARQAEDLRYISDPNQWVSITLLCPVKRYVLENGFQRLQTAYLTGDGPNLYHGNMWAPKSDDQREAFESFKAIIDAGWEVD